jgi:hypothetical protein
MFFSEFLRRRAPPQRSLRPPPHRAVMAPKAASATGGLQRCCDQIESLLRDAAAANNNTQKLRHILLLVCWCYKSGSNTIVDLDRSWLAEYREMFIDNAPQKPPTPLELAAALLQDIMDTWSINDLVLNALPMVLDSRVLKVSKVLGLLVMFKEHFDVPDMDDTETVRAVFVSLLAQSVELAKVRASGEPDAEPDVADDQPSSFEDGMLFSSSVQPNDEDIKKGQAILDNLKGMVAFWRGKHRHMPNSRKIFTDMMNFMRILFLARHTDYMHYLETNFQHVVHHQRNNFLCDLHDEDETEAKKEMELVEHVNRWFVRVDAYLEDDVMSGMAVVMGSMSWLLAITETFRLPSPPQDVPAAELHDPKHNLLLEGHIRDVLAAAEARKADLFLLPVNFKDVAGRGEQRPRRTTTYVVAIRDEKTDLLFNRVVAAVEAVLECELDLTTTRIMILGTGTRNLDKGQVVGDRIDPSRNRIEVTGRLKGGMGGDRMSRLGMKFRSSLPKFRVAPQSHETPVKDRLKEKVAQRKKKQAVADDTAAAAEVPPDMLPDESSDFGEEDTEALESLLSVQAAMSNMHIRSHEELLEFMLETGRELEKSMAEIEELVAVADPQRKKKPMKKLKTIGRDD